MTLKDALLLIRQFEDCSLPKEEWTHAAHFIMAGWYCTRLPLPLAMDKIRSGIRNYNECVNPGAIGYHETITVFYTMTIANYLLTAGISELTDDTLSAFLQQPFFEKDYLHRFYSQDVLAGAAARSTWIKPHHNAISATNIF
jgi:hypothetical protein